MLSRTRCAQGTAIAEPAWRGCKGISGVSDRLRRYRAWDSVDVPSTGSECCILGAVAKLKACACLSTQLPDPDHRSARSGISRGS